MSDEQDISPEAIRALIDILAKPIDFQALEAQGVLKKEGSRYRLLKPKELPEHASRKIEEIEFGDGGSFAKFESEKPYQKLRDQLK